MKVLYGLLLLAGGAFGQLAGTVRDAASKLPVNRAQVRVYGNGTSKSAESNSSGAFQVDDLPAGKYQISFSQGEYDLGNASVEVKAGGSTVTLELNPWAEVEGLVLDEDGRPLEGVLVYVGSGLRGPTGKDGHYRARQIPAGNTDLAFRLPYELRRKTAVHDAKTGETFGYPGTLYYPGVADRKLAVPVAIAPGARITHFDVRLRRTQLVELKGKVAGAPAGAEVELESGGNRPDETYDKRKLDQHGGFLFDLLQPGEHTLIVHRNGPGDDLPYITQAAPGLDVVLPPFVRIDGMVRTAHPELQWEGTLRVMLARSGYGTEVRVSEAGTFALENIPPGTWQFTLDDNLLHIAGDPNKRVYALATQAALNVTESGNPPVEILLTDQTGTLTGSSDEPFPVMISSASSGHMRVAMPRPDGGFTAELPPGEYRVLASGKGCKGERVTIEPGGTANVNLKCK